MGNKLQSAIAARVYKGLARCILVLVLLTLIQEGRRICRGGFTVD
jgi:hypothetical protein